jgi:uncharacterized protein YbjQ (UPF0145 family)
MAHGDGGRVDDDYFAPPHPAETAGSAASGVVGYPTCTTSMGVPGFTVSADMGTVFGVVVRSLGVARGFVAGLQSMAGGEVSQYTQVLEDSRRSALDRMLHNAHLLGADAVVAMRFDSSEIGQGLTEVVAYGAAVKLSAVSG